jgi:hypothetical protein
MSDEENIEQDNHYASPTAYLGDYTIEFVERCQEEFGEDFELGEVLIVAEVTHGDKTVVEVLSSEARAYVAQAILSRALAIVQGHELAEAREAEDE